MIANLYITFSTHTYYCTYIYLQTTAESFPPLSPTKNLPLPGQGGHGPLLSGTGVKGKISQAMKYGVPVVATSVAIEGMHMLHGVDTLVGDNAVTFADRLVQLYTNCQLWDALAGGGLANIRLNFSPEKARTQLLLALSEAGVPPRGVNDKHCP